MTVTVIGTGYVGLVMGACFADLGNRVICLDIDADKIAGLEAGRIPIYEPGLEALVKQTTASGHLRFTTSYDEAAKRSDIFFIAVGTPPDEDGSADLRHVLGAARAVAERLTGRAVIVNKSTVPVGTADKVRAAVAEVLARRGVDYQFAVISNPEFLKEGAALQDFMRPDRIVLGGDERWAIDAVAHLYAPLNRNHDKLLVTDTRSAELTKYASNAMLATRISFMNELARLSEAVGADIDAVRRGMGSDARIGTHFLYAGCGYGGSCFPKDVKALIHTGADNGLEMGLVRAVEAVNDRQKGLLFDKIAAYYGGVERLAGKCVALWGLAFKPGTDDMREAPSTILIEALLQAGARVQAYDPVAVEEARRIFGDASGLKLCRDAEAALAGADCLAVVTEWREFRSPDFAVLADKLSDRVIFDGRNMYERSDLDRAGLAYFDFGRNAVVPKEA